MQRGLFLLRRECGSLADEASIRLCCAESGDKKERQEEAHGYNDEKSGADGQER